MVIRRKEFGNILVLTHWSFNDPLIQTYTLPYVKIIRNILPINQNITLVTYEQEKIALTADDGRRVNDEWKVNNLQLIAHSYRPMGIGKLMLLLYQLFELVAIIKKQRISTIHCLCTPAGSIGYMLSKITGTRLIIDSYEPHAESMIENGTWSRKSLAFLLLFWLEKMQSKRCACFIATSAGMKDYAREKYDVYSNNFYTKPACVDLEKFVLSEKDSFLVKDLELKDKIVCVYAGKLGGIYLKSEVFDFIKECYRHWGDEFRFLLLTNSDRADVLTEIVRVGLPERVVLQIQVKHNVIPKYLALGDFAINPVKPVPTKRYCTSIKDGEYWAVGLPVVITKDISDDSEIIRKSGYGYELNELSNEEYKRAIVAVDNLISGDIAILKQNIRQLAEVYRSFEIAKNIYMEVYS